MRIRTVSRPRLFRAARAAGFSLVEILLVIVIILMLAGALVVFVLPQQDTAARNTTLLKLEQFEEALQLYKTNVGMYPSEEQGGLAALLKKPEFKNERIGDRWTGPYLKRGATLDDAWGHKVRYEVVDKSLQEDKGGPDYRLYSVGPDGQAETDDDIKLYDDKAGLDGGSDLGGGIDDLGTGGGGGGAPVIPGPGTGGSSSGSP